MADRTFTGTRTAFPGVDEHGPLAVRKIGVADLRDALEKGWNDFWQKPSHLVFLGLIYPLAGVFLCRLVVGYDILPLLFPLVAGFALVGPFAALGLYEISRRLEQGQDAAWADALNVMRSPGLLPLAILGFTLMMIFVLWLIAAMVIYSAIFGDMVPATVSGFLHEVITTRAGWTLILVGNAVGFLFALAALMISVVSFPLILDRHVGALAAARTSINAVVTNPGPMLLWGLIVAVALVIGFATLLVGLAIIVPVLGHATWHLYRRVVI